MQPADIGSIYRVYHDITTLRTLYNDYINEGGDKSTQGRKSNTPVISIPWWFYVHHENNQHGNYFNLFIKHLFSFLLWDNMLKATQFDIRIQGWDIPKTCMLKNNLNLVKSQPSYIFIVTYNQLRKWRILSNWLWIFHMFHYNFLFYIQMNWS